MRVMIDVCEPSRRISRFWGHLVSAVDLLFYYIFWGVLWDHPNDDWRSGNSVSILAGRCHWTEQLPAAEDGFYILQVIHEIGRKDT